MRHISDTGRKGRNGEEAGRSLVAGAMLVLAALALTRVATHDGTSMASAATLPEPPRLVTAPAEEVKFTGAKLAGSVNPHGSPTTYYFAWGTSYTSLSNRTPELSAGQGTHSELVHQLITGLEPGHEYFFQLIATNGGGTSKGSIGHLVTLKDAAPPVIELSGPLTEGLKEATTEYPLHVHATDGEAASPGSGVKTITIAVDGETVDSVEGPACPEGNCALDAEWTFDSGTDPGEHEVTVTATDFAANVGEAALSLGMPDGSIPACDPEDPTSTVATPDETIALPGGGTLSVFHTKSGPTYKIPTPPAGFDPLTASAAELERYGVPPRPTEAAALAEWEEAFGGAEPDRTASLCDTASQRQTEKATTSTEEVETQPTWAGFLAWGPEQTNTYLGVKGRFSVAPTFANPCPLGGVSSWVGLGGFTRGESEEAPLLQTGVARDRPHREAKPYAWIASIPSTGAYRERVLPLHVNPEDRIEGGVRFFPASHSATVFLNDLTTAEYFPEVTIENLGGNFEGLGSTADFVDERDSRRNGNPYEMEKFGVDHWFAANVLTGGAWQPLGHVTRRRLVMRAGGTGKVLAETSGLGSEAASFSDIWNACHG